MKNEESNIGKVGEANRENVLLLVNHLVDAYTQFYIDHKLSYMDGFMGVHNFHKIVILDLEARVEDTGKFLRNMAVTTFVESLK